MQYKPSSEKKYIKGLPDKLKPFLKRMRILLIMIIITPAVCFIGIPLLFNSAYANQMHDADTTYAFNIIPSPTVTVEITNTPFYHNPKLKTEDISVQDMSNTESYKESSETPVISYQFGDRNDEIIKLQQRLMELGYMESDDATNYFGPATEKAVSLFQRAYQSEITGVADSVTLSLLFSLDAPFYAITYSQSGDDVLQLQERLDDLGFYDGKLNGYFGKATERALIAFQKKNSLNADGIADESTRNLISSPKAKPKIDPTPTPKPTPKVMPKPTATPKTKPKPNNSPSSGLIYLTPAPTQAPSSFVSYGSGVEGLIAAAASQLNKPYVWGDEGSVGFDCSGLVYYSLRCSGVSIKRYSAYGFSQVESWAFISDMSQLRRGDLIFFRSDSSSNISHVGIYLGDNTYIHASSSAGRVIISSWSNWASRNLVGGRRVF